MVPAPGPAVPQPDMLADALGLLRTRLSGLAAEHEDTCGHVFSLPADQSNVAALRTVGMADRQIVDIALVLLDGIMEPLRLHKPRPTPFLGAPPRCAHDNQSWPCRTRAQLEKALARVFVRDTWPGEAS